MIKAGPLGRKGTGNGVEWDEKGRTVISHIYISFSNPYISSIQFGYLENGVLVVSKKFGGSTEGHNLKVVTLNQDEYVTGLSGVQESGLIKNLTFHTNCGKHGPIGNSNVVKSSDSKIEIETGIHDRREFSGFFGSYSSSYLTSIGIYVSPIARSGTVVKRENI